MDTEICTLIGVYPYDVDEGLFLIEMQINEKPAAINCSLFLQKDLQQQESDWQTAYDERFLSADGTEIIGDWYNVAEIPGTNSRIAFFMYVFDFSLPLSTPYGDFLLTNVQKMPDRLKKIIELDPVD